MAILIAACGNTEPTPIPAALGAAAGDNQNAIAGEAVPIDPAVVVTDAAGAPVGGVTVTFAVQSGGGSVAGATITTNGQGVATVGSWTLGPTAGLNELQASVSGVTPLIFSATGTAGTASIVTATAGGGQTAPNSTVLPVDPTVTVTDVNGNAVAGQAVTFSVVSGGGSVTSPVTTDQNGEASATWTLGGSVGTQELTATVPGGTTAAAFTADATLGSPSGITTVGNNQATVVGTPVPQPIVITVRDLGGNPLIGVDVTFTPAAGSGSVTGGMQTSDANGVATLGSWTLGTGAGNQTMTVTAGSTTLGIISATGLADAAAQLGIESGDNQTWAVGSASPNQPTVRARDQYGNIAAGASITFTPGAGSGTVTGSPATTDANGDATVAWSLGQAGTNTLEASGAGTNTVTFTATGVVTAYTMELRFTGSTAGLDLQAFSDAALRWMTIISGDLPDVDYSVGFIPANACGINHAAVNSVVDDILLLVEPVNLDGPGGALAGATWCDRRSGALPSVGVMVFDIADLNFPVFTDVVIHEMGHALGIGSLWDAAPWNYLVNPSLPSSPGADTHFTGPQAIIEFDNVGGAGRTVGMKVPVENTQGGQGTRDSHWRESTFDNELMTGFVSTGGNPLSAVTIGSLQDLGYVVDLGQADSYTISNPNALRVAVDQIPLGPDVLIVPQREVDAFGRTVKRSDP